MQPACRCRPLPIVPAIVLLVLPKCPLCVCAWLGLSGALGLGSIIVGAWGLPLGAVLVLITISALSVRAFRTRDLRPVWLGLLGAAALMGGKQFSNILLLSAGACLLLLASALPARSRGRVLPSH